MSSGTGGSGPRETMSWERGGGGAPGERGGGIPDIPDLFPTSGGVKHGQRARVISPPGAGAAPGNAAGGSPMMGVNGRLGDDIKDGALTVGGEGGG